MISKNEILAIADETGLTPNVVEKDYVLGWLLAAVNNNHVLAIVDDTELTPNVVNAMHGINDKRR